MRTTLLLLFLALAVISAVRLPLPSASLGRYRGGDVALVGANDDDDNVGDRKKTTGGVQFMITLKMRNTLKKDLGYHDDEINDMAPQIAAVVIERSLTRPKKGMPPSWRRSSGGVMKAWWKLQLPKRFKALCSVVQDCATGATAFLVEQSERPAVRAVGAVLALWVVKDPILQNAAVAWQIIAAKAKDILPSHHKVSAYQLTPQYHKRSLKSVLEGQPVRPERGWLNWLGRRGSWPAERGSGNQRRSVDVDALSRAQQLSLWDRISLRFARNRQ